MGEATRKPWHVAFHYLGCAEEAPDGIRVPSLQAPMVEAMAQAFDRLTVVAYDPPAVVRSSEEHSVDQLVRSDGRIDRFSLGPVGDWRDVGRRGRRVAERLARASVGWDVLVLWLMNRRIRTVTKSSRTRRVVAIDGSCVSDEARVERVPFWRKAEQTVVADLTERVGRAAIRDSGLVVVNSEMLAERHRRLNRSVVVRRWTRRRADVGYQVADRLTRREVHVLVAGRLTPYKGVFEALEVFRRVKETVLPGAVLHIAGDGDALPELKRRVDEAGLGDRVTFHGWIGGDALFELYRRCDLLLHLSYAESFPRVVLEALAHSVPVICTRVGGVHDLLEHEREVLFVPVETVEPVVDAVRRLTEDPELRRGLISRGFVAAEESSTDAFVAYVIGDIERTWPEIAGSAAPTTDGSSGSP